MSPFPLYSSPEDFCAQVRGILKQSGVSLAEADVFNFYLYLETTSKAASCAAAARTEGFEVEVRRSETDGGKPWLCLASRRITPSVKRLTEVGALFLRLAEQYGGEFDGWEIQPNPAQLTEGLLKSLMEKFSIQRKESQNGSP